MVKKAHAPKKTGSQFSFAPLLGATGLLGAAMLWLPFAVPSAFGAGAEFSATVDRNEVSLDESVSLRFVLRSEGGVTGGGQPRFVAPDFEELNEYQDMSIESRYENGQFLVRNIQRLTKVLKPLKAGTLKIGGIEIQVGNDVLRSPDITIRVSGSGAGTPPPRGYGGGGMGLRGAGKGTVGKNVMVRTEVDKMKVYKGEQLIVSYYLYHRVPMFELSADKFPVLSGFLREELEMPIQSRLDPEITVLDGVEYRRALLARFAAYPLQTGKLKIDSMAVKFNYSVRGDADDTDPFSVLFGRQSLRRGAERSEVLTIDVMPVPTDGKPDSYAGAVGDFSVSSAVDKYEVRANEAVSVTVKIEGKGNVASIGEPRARWPESVEVYDTKARSKAGSGGVGEKVFEYVLIPRKPGSLSLPGVELSFFDPTSGKYQVKTTEPIQLTVGEAAPGSDPGAGRAPRPAPDDTSAPTRAKPAVIEPRYLLPPEKSDSSRFAGGLPVWRWLYWLCIAAFVGFIGYVGYDVFQRRRAGASARTDRKSAAGWDRIRQIARDSKQGASWNDVLLAYDDLASRIFDALDERFALGARSYSRSVLGEKLTNDLGAVRGISTEDWERINSLLEFAELIKFASSTGVISESTAREQLPRWVQEGEAIVRLLARS